MINLYFFENLKKIEIYILNYNSILLFIKSKFKGEIYCRFMIN